MFRAFHVAEDARLIISNPGFHEVGRQLRNDDAAAIKRKLESYLRDDGSLDGTEMQKNWFPSIPADVFLSHSHKDLDLTLALAGWLFKTFGLRPFIDSCVWGNADDLLKQIDDKYCLNPSGGTYSYEKRNGSTSHVHIMLSTALAMMIDNAECAWVLNTTNSITPSDAALRTASPWIFSEIATMQLIRRRPKAAHRERLIKLAKGEIREWLNEGPLRITYEVPVESFTSIRYEILRKWEASRKVTYPLDQLYELAPESQASSSIPVLLRR